MWQTVTERPGLRAAQGAGAALVGVAGEAEGLDEGRGEGGGGPARLQGVGGGTAVPEGGEEQDPRRKNLRGQVVAALAEFPSGEVVGVGRGDARPR